LGVLDHRAPEEHRRFADWRQKADIGKAEGEVLEGGAFWVGEDIGENLDEGFDWQDLGFALRSSPEGKMIRAD
jgi:hypothetical protein